MPLPYAGTREDWMPARPEARKTDKAVQPGSGLPLAAAGHSPGLALGQRSPDFHPRQ
jgi:hypothetical protein